VTNSLGNRRGILTAAVLILLGNLVSRLLGLVREQVIAGYFGVSVVTSAFQTASTVPTMFYDLVIGGAVSAALIPVLSGYFEEDDREELGRVVGTLLTGAALILGLLVGLLLLIAGPVTIVLGVAPGDRVYGATVEMVRIVVPALLFLGLAGVAGAVCYARRWTAYPAAAIALFNGGLVLTTVLLHQRLGGASLVLGMMAGAVLQLLAVLPGLSGIPIRPGLDLAHPAVRRIVRLYAPVAAGLVITELGVLFDRHFAWQTGDLSLSVMRYATTIVQLPLGLVGTATSLAALPLLSRLVDRDDEYRQTLCTGLRLALLAILPALAFLVVFTEPTIRIIFQRGAFDAAATSLTVRAFLLYAPQLPFVAVDQLLVYAFYARKNTVTPMLVGLAGVGIYLVTALLSIGPLQLGLSGLIIANTLQNSLHAVILFVLLTRAAGSLSGYGLGATVARGVLAALVAGAAGALLVGRLSPPAGTAALLAYLVAGGAVVLGCYLGSLHVLGVDEATVLPRLVRARLARSAGVAGG
jgi:putative peptidoglycan lipid II flippase